MFSIGASKIANTARENVSRYGHIAGQKVFEEDSKLLEIQCFEFFLNSIYYLFF